MPRIELPGAAWALPLAAAVFFIASQAVSAADGHRFEEGECSFCHRGTGKGSNMVLQSPAEDISPQCVNCHAECDNWHAHRDGNAGTLTMQTVLPVLGDGGLTCITCHSPHGLPTDEDGPRLSGLLRMENLKRELCLNCHHGEGPARWSVEVVAPPSSVVVYEEYLPLLGRSEALPGGHLEVQINGASFPVPVKNGVFHTRLRLQEGLNAVDVVFRGERLWRGEVFRSSAEEEDAASYERAFFTHQTRSISECFGCHRQKDGLLRGDTLEAPALCYGCHDHFDEKRYLHGPLAVGACMICHDPHGGKGRSYLRMTEVDLCRTCHRDEEVLGHDGGRRAMADGSCSSCHDPHQSDRRFLTKQAGL